MVERSSKVIFVIINLGIVSYNRYVKLLLLVKLVEFTGVLLYTY